MPAWELRRRSEWVVVLVIMVYVLCLGYMDRPEFASIHINGYRLLCSLLQSAVVTVAVEMAYTAGPKLGTLL